MHAQSTHLENVLCALLNSACVVFEKGALLTHSCCVLFREQKEVILANNTCTGVCSLILQVLCMLKAHIS